MHFMSEVVKPFKPDVVRSRNAFITRSTTSRVKNRLGKDSSGQDALERRIECAGVSHNVLSSRNNTVKITPTESYI